MKYLNKSVVLSKEQHLTPRFRRGLLPLSILLISLIGTGCKKLVDVPAPDTSLTNSNVYTSDASAASVLTGIYSSLSSSSGNIGGGVTTISFLSGLSADELTLFNGNTNVSWMSYYKNNLSTENGGFEFWGLIYPYIFTCNEAIEGLTGNSVLTPGVQRQLLGEAKFMRAFFFFYLVNLYGDIPMPLTTDYKVNALLSKTPKSTVYNQIATDLNDAKDLLTSDYVYSDAESQTQERTRPNRWAALALLARTYLYMQKWDSAQIESSLVISNTSLYKLDTLNGVFLKNSNESIWQLQPVNAGANTEDALLFVLPESGPGSAWPVYLSRSLVNNFELGDGRRMEWVDSVIVGDSTYYYPDKYKVNLPQQPVTEYLMMFRLGEQYLVRSEAEAQLGDSTGSVIDLNIIRNRAMLPNYAIAVNGPLLAAILHERRVELFTEMGQRWLDLKRLGLVDLVMGTDGACALKGGIWESFQQLYPIPIQDVTADVNLTQNSGY